MLSKSQFFEKLQTSVVSVAYCNVLYTFYNFNCCYVSVYDSTLDERFEVPVLEEEQLYVHYSRISNLKETTVYVPLPKKQSIEFEI